MLTNYVGSVGVAALGQLERALPWRWGWIVWRYATSKDIIEKVLRISPGWAFVTLRNWNQRRDSHAFDRGRAVAERYRDADALLEITLCTK